MVLEKETFGGQITFSPKVENYPTVMQMSGNEFADKMLEQVITHGASIELANAEGIEKVENGFIVKTDCGDFEGKTVIIAAGSKHRQLGLDRENEFVGEGVSYCAVCDGAFYAGKEVAVIGGGNTALQEAVMLSEYCTKVTVVQNLAQMTGEGRLLANLEKRDNVSLIYNTVVTELRGNNKLEGIVIKNTETEKTELLKLDGVFVAIGQVPENEAFTNLTELNKWGYIDAGEDCLTKTPGLYVAGDCRSKSVRQITTATADGAVAALAACRYIDSL
jgi:thioredoxin reductase (NADPH)